jgi:hypothetical protein
MNKHADKSTALAALSKKYGVKQNEILAFGDNNNDVRMLQYAKIGVAVSNANEKAKQAADYVLSYTNNQSPITAFIKKIGLI